MIFKMPLLPRDSVSRCYLDECFVGSGGYNRQDVNQQTLLDCQIGEVPCKLPGFIEYLSPLQKLYLSVWDQLIEYKEVAQVEPRSVPKVKALASLIEKLRPPRRPYDVRSTNWYPQYFQTNVQQIQNCIDKVKPRGSVEWREKLFGSWVTWFSDDPKAEVLQIVLLGVDPPSVENAATIKEFQALHEDCLEAQREGKISADAQLIFIRVPEALVSEQIEVERKHGRCVIIASCHEDQREIVYQTYKRLLKTTSEKERLQFTPLKRDAARPLPPESRRWKMMVLFALLPTLFLSVILLQRKPEPVDVCIQDGHEAAEKIKNVLGRLGYSLGDFYGITLCLPSPAAHQQVCHKNGGDTKRHHLHDLLCSRLSLSWTIFQVMGVEVV